MSFYTSIVTRMTKIWAKYVFLFNSSGKLKAALSDITIKYDAPIYLFKYVHKKNLHKNVVFLIWLYKSNHFDMIASHSGLHKGLDLVVLGTVHENSCNVP